MCGIAGYWDWHLKLDQDNLHDAILGMTQSLRHRGPDSGGLYIDKGVGLALGHRRLAIRDLSPLGHQPMISPDGRYALSYNGEIYNAKEIAANLAKKNMYPQGTSDTEILLLSLMAFGIEDTLKSLLGMFAFALWDRRERSLFLARDRFGVKPLYWTKDGGARFLFASEPDAFFCAPKWNPEVDHDAIALYLRFGYIPAPWSIWKNVFKLHQAHYMRVDKEGSRLIPYWNAQDIAARGLANPLPVTEGYEEEVTERLDALLTDAVRRRMISDVPLGAFLSGGIDSSVVVALMQKCNPRPVRTFCIGFEEEGYNEAPYAKAVAAHLGTDHTELYLPAKAAWDVIPRLPDIYDEPFGDASAVPTTLLSELTRRFVTISLSGDGGDELFAGYARYAQCMAAVPEFTQPNLVKKLWGKALKAMSPHVWDELAAILPKKLRPANAGTRVHNFVDLKLNGTFAAFYQRYFMQYIWHPDTLLAQGLPPATLADDWNIGAIFADGLALMQFLDTSLYLPDDILVKVDRASMSCSLEARTPLLDHRVYELAWQIPPQWRMAKGKGKYFLRKVLSRYLPESLFERPKMGFGIPIGQWITGPLKEWSENLLSEKSLKNDGIFRHKKIRAIWEKQLSGASNWEYHLWIILMLQAWLGRERRKPILREQLPTVWA